MVGFGLAVVGFVQLVEDDNGGMFPRVNSCKE